jgi:hypothetical protein
MTTILARRSVRATKTLTSADLPDGRDEPCHRVMP